MKKKRDLYGLALRCAAKTGLIPPDKEDGSYLDNDAVCTFFDLWKALEEESDNSRKEVHLMTDTMLTIFLAVATVLVGLIAVRVLLDIWRDHFA